MSDNTVAADPWGLPVEPSPASSDPAEQPTPDPAGEIPEAGTSDADETVSDDGQLDAPEPATQPSAAGTFAADGADSAELSGEATATGDPVGDSPDAGIGDQETGDDIASVSEAVDQLIPDAGSTEPDPDFQMALPSTPEPFVRISSGEEPQEPPDANAHADDADIGVGSENPQDGEATAADARLDPITAPDDEPDFGDAAVADPGIADEIASLSAALAGDSGDDVAIEAVAAATDDDPDAGDDAIGDDEDSLLAAIDQLGVGEAELEIVTEPEEAAETPDGPETLDQADLSDAGSLAGGLFGTQPAEIGEPAGDAATFDGGALLNGSVDAGAEDDYEDEPAISWTPEADAARSLFDGSTDSAPLFGGDVTPDDAAITSGERETNPGETSPPETNPLGPVEAGEPDEPVMEAPRDDAPAVIFGAPSDASEAGADSDPSGDAAEHAPLLSESVAHHLGGDADTNDSKSSDAAGVSSVIDDIPDELPSWAVNRTTEPSDDVDAPGSDPSSAEEAVQAAESLWSAPDASEPASGLDAPLSSQPVPSAYRELETLPPLPGTPADAGTDSAAAEPAPDAQEAGASDVTGDTAGEPVAAEPAETNADDAAGDDETPGIGAPAAAIAADPFAPDQTGADEPAPAEQAGEQSATAGPEADLDAPEQQVSTDGPTAGGDDHDAPVTDPSADVTAGEDEPSSPGTPEEPVQDEAADASRGPEADEPTVADDAGTEVSEDSDALDAQEQLSEPAAAEAGAAAEGPGPNPAGSHPLPAQWASRWAESAQGWVDLDGDGSPSEWRPIVASVDTIAGWTVETYLGLVSGDAALADHHDLAAARDAATAAMVEESLARGAHAVIGVSLTASVLGDATIITATGTAVTLTPTG